MNELGMEWKRGNSCPQVDSQADKLESEGWRLRLGLLLGERKGASLTAPALHTDSRLSLVSSSSNL